MKENYRFLSQSWLQFSSIICTLLVVSGIAPFTSVNDSTIYIPQPIYPENYANTTSGSDPPLGVPSFSWTRVTGANVYRLQVDNELGFNHPVFLDISTENTSYTPILPGQLFTDGEWYWRVRVENPTPVGDWSPIIRFSKTWATPDNTPTLLTPVDGEPLAFFDSPAFSWTPVVGAARYRFQISGTPEGFNTPLFSLDTISTSYQPNDRLANNVYYWRIVPIDIVDHLGTSSDVQSFIAAYGTQSFEDMIPTLVSPQDESFPTFTPTFRWTAINGAEHYRLEYTSDITCDFSVGETFEIHQTSYTVTDTFPNNIRYCWRVRVESGPAIGEWSDIWHFQKTWDIKPILLTPTNHYQTAVYPLFSWTPIPGASRYLIQISQNPSFIPIYEESFTSNTTYAPQEKYFETSDYYWHVRPIDGGGEYGIASDISEFHIKYNTKAPILIYPLYYYQPNNYGELSMVPYEDRTVAFPIFMWHRVMVPAPKGGVSATAYRIQVAKTPYFDFIEWHYDTENTSATPIANLDFIPAPDQDYYWRVCPLDSMNNGECLTDPESSSEWWSQIWIARFSNTLELTPTIGLAPELLRPEIGEESVEATPLLEWWPLLDATQYQVEVSRDVDFSTLEISETVNIPAYSPNYSLAQRNLGRIDYGTFYWHVRGYTEDGWSNWSEVWRFQIASQSEWRYTRTRGNEENKLPIGHDPTGDASPIYDLTTLYASQSESYWYFGFDAYTSTTDMTYVFYIDLDNIDNSGATSPPERTYHVTTNTDHQPEYVIYVDVIGGVIDNYNTSVFAWNGSSWGFGQEFSDFGGSVYVSSGYVELKIPNGAIGMSREISSASVMLFSVNISNKLIQDSVPSDPEVPGNAILSRFSAVSERMNLVYPPNTVSGDPSTYASLFPFYWDWPTGSNGATPFGGSILQVDLEPNYLPPHEATFQIKSNTSYFSENNVTLLTDITGDNIYYWRIQPRYFSEGYPEVYGAWTGGWSFHRLGFIAENLYTSSIAAPLTFGWDMVEGASIYRLQVSTDPNFGSTVIDQVTPMNSYTPQSTLSQGNYYWRVQVNRYGNVVNDWSKVEQFSYVLPTPTGLTSNGDTYHYAPTLCWDPLVIYDNDEPVFTAWKYRFQVSQDSDFGNTYESIDTYNNCWTPTIGYPDGTYYWHVAMIDGNNRVGPYSPSATFTKLYPITTLINPSNGFVSWTPTFIWTSVSGAASYVFEVSWYSTFPQLYDSVETVNTHYTPTIIYQSDKVYYWRVAIRDRDGKQGSFTDWFFQIAESTIYLPLINR